MPLREQRGPKKGQFKLDIGKNLFSERTMMQWAWWGWVEVEFGDLRALFQPYKKKQFKGL